MWSHKKMIVLLAFLVMGGVEGEVKKEDSVPRDGLGNSQQYHYSSYPQHGGGGHTGLSFDLSTGITVIISIFLIMALIGLFYSFSGKGGSGSGSGSGGWGWESRNFSAKSAMDVVKTAEKVLNGVEKVYEVYKKSQ